MVGALFAPPKRSGTLRKHFDKGSPDATLVCYTSDIGHPARKHWSYLVPWMGYVGVTLKRIETSPHLKTKYLVRVYAKRK